MSQTSHDARAIARAIDALTTRLTDALTGLATQVKRAADARQSDFALTPDAVDDAPTTADDAPCAHHPHAPVIGGHCGGCTVYPADMRPAPAADEDAQRTARRNSAHNLLARLDRGGLLSPADCALLRQHFDAETREHDTARAVARSNLRHVQTIVPEIDRLTAELEQAQAAVERVRALKQPFVMWRDIAAALDGTEQPTTEA
ncbi:hypothetical protein ABTZ58_03800 [Streptomyces sp. NPDC094143]|uniref:hypothetical protein n=1 Tax=unclassified Streptomyces TaxID=2593676 RepID=UPI00331AE27E